MLGAASSLGSTPEELETKTLLHFVARATALRRAAPDDFAQLWSIMQGTAVTLSTEEERSCSTVAKLLQAAAPADAALLHVSVVRQLCMKDKTAIFAVMMPPADDAAADGGMGDRRVRGYACYPRLSLVNHR